MSYQSNNNNNNSNVNELTDLEALNEIINLSSHFKSTKFSTPTSNDHKSFSLSSLLSPSLKSKQALSLGNNNNQQKQLKSNYGIGFDKIRSAYEKIQDYLKRGIAVLNNETKKVEFPNFEVTELLDYEQLDRIEECYLLSKQQSKSEHNSDSSISSMDGSNLSLSPSIKNQKNPHMKRSYSTNDQSPTLRRTGPFDQNHFSHKDFEYRINRDKSASSSENDDNAEEKTSCRKVLSFDINEPQDDLLDQIIASSSTRNFELKPSKDTPYKRQYSAPSLLDHSRDIMEISEWLYENELDDFKLPSKQEKLNNEDKNKENSFSIIHEQLTLDDEDFMLLESPSPQKPKLKQADSIHDQFILNDSQLSQLDSQTRRIIYESQKDLLHRRFLVLEVSQNERRSRIIRNQKREKVLRVIDESNDSEEYVILKDSWYDSYINVGDYVNVIGRPEPKDSNSRRTYIIDDHRNAIITNPDHMVSGTVISQSFECERKAFINGHFKMRNTSFHMNGPNLSLPIYGHIVHNVFQRAIINNDFSTESLKKFIDEAILLYIADLYMCNETDESIKSKIQSFIPAIQNFKRKHFDNIDYFDNNNGQSTMKRRQKNTTLAGQDYYLKVIQPLDIEEQIWSVMYGIKGNIDITIEAELVKTSSNNIENEEKKHHILIPLELKSNNISSTHSAQVVLYSLLLSDRYNQDIQAGMLYSLKNEDSICVNINRETVRSVLIRRNELARYFTKHKLPSLLSRPSTCQRCYQLENCMRIHKLLENGNEESSKINPQLFQQLTGFLTVKHEMFFKKWNALINLESEELMKSRSYIWRVSHKEREKLGRCLNYMKVLDETKIENNFGGSGYIYTFQSWKKKSILDMFDLQFGVGDYVILSEGKHFAVASGVVYEISKDKIMIKLSSKLNVPPRICDSAPSSQRFLGLGNDQTCHQFKFPIKSNYQFDNTVDIEDLGYVTSQTNETKITELKWRIDKDELVSSSSILRGNLLQLFDLRPRNQRKRELIVDLMPPRFTDIDDELTPPSTSNVDYSKLNVSQRLAIKKVLTAKDCALLLGMPGTGKSTTISYIVQALIQRNKTVLITAFTHNAVDSLLLKIKDLGIKFLRLGQSHNIMPELREFAFNFDKSIRSIEDMRRHLNKESFNVIATTCFSIAHPLLLEKTFDYVIIDEASQLTLPVCLGPILLADVFVLVGDTYQLPPLVKNLQAREQGFCVSLFNHLLESHPNAVQKLQYQYRMNADIMTLANELIYQNQLKCGNDEVARSRLKIDNLHLKCPPLKPEYTTHWLVDVLNPDKSVLFLNTDEIPAYEDVGFDKQFDETCRNETEVKIVTIIAYALSKCEIDQQDIGILSPWKSQLKSIHYSLKEIDLSSIEIQTVDRFQGRDKDCIIFSLVRSNSLKNVGSLLKNWKRVNVAFTRAKKKLLIVGSRSTLERNHLFSYFFKNIIDKRKWQYNLPPNAHEMYNIND